MNTYKVELDPQKQVINEGQWPATVLGKGREVRAISGTIAIDSVSHATGISCWALKATEIKKPARKYRYRSPLCGSVTTPTYVKRHLAKLGEIKTIRGYRYERWNAKRDEQGRIVGSYRTVHEAVLVIGLRGSARFSGVCWGYGGSGPHALRDALVEAGVRNDLASQTAFTATRRDDLGWDWELRAAPELPEGFYLAARI